MMRTTNSAAAEPRRRAVIFVALSLAIAVGGCGESSHGLAEPGTETARSPLAAEEAGADIEVAEMGTGVTVTDRRGRQVRFENPPQRIVSLTPSITEVLFAIGAGDRIVGATTHCNYPPQAEQIPRVGGGTLESLNQELIVGLEPDLVLCKWDHHEPLLGNLDRLEIQALGLGPENLEELYDQTAMLGRITGRESQAAAVIAAMRRRVAAVTDRIPAGQGPMVFYQVWDEPLMTAGPHSFIGELLSLAGARNLFEATPIRYPKVSPEVVVAGDPEVILAPTTHSTPVTVDSILNRPGWGQVRAIRERRVYLIEGDRISRCGPRLVDALEEIASVLYPDRFASPDPVASSSGAVENEEGTE